MTTQLFKSNIPNNILFDFLDSIYLFKMVPLHYIKCFLLKKPCFLNLIDNFVKTIKNTITTQNNII